jgi:hypothetical protein
MEPSHEVLTLTRIGSGHYVLAGRAPAELRLSGWRSRAAAVVAGERFELRHAGLFDRRVVALRADGTEFVSLSRRRCDVPGLADCGWRIRARVRGYEARLSSPGVLDLVVRTGHGGRSDVTAELAGAVPNRDLVVLVAAFAVLLRRREDSSAAAGAAVSVAAVS